MAILWLMCSFLVGAAVSGVASAAIDVYWLGAFDPKFQDAPSAAFEVEMWGLLVLCLVATAVTGVVGLFLRKHLRASPRALALCALWGVAYPLLPRLIVAPLEHIVDVESLLIPVVGWLFLVAFPAVAMFALRSVKSSEARHAL